MHLQGTEKEFTIAHFLKKIRANGGLEILCPLCHQGKFYILKLYSPLYRVKQRYEFFFPCLECNSEECFIFFIVDGGAGHTIKVVSNQIRQVTNSPSPPGNCYLLSQDIISTNSELRKSLEVQFQYNSEYLQVILVQSNSLYNRNLAAVLGRLV